MNHTCSGNTLVYVYPVCVYPHTCTCTITLNHERCQRTTHMYQGTVITATILVCEGARTATLGRQRDYGSAVLPGQDTGHGLQGSDCAATVVLQMSKAAGGGDDVGSAGRDAVCQGGALAAAACPAFFVTLRFPCNVCGLRPEEGLSQSDPQCWGHWLAPLGALLPGGTTGSGKSPLNGAVPAQGGGSVGGRQQAVPRP